jgi:predicted ATP-grasp superfamily ATP-dependent carboligase
MKIIVIFSGYNQRAVISLLRVLFGNRIPFVIVTSGPKDAIYHSRYKSSICFERKEKALELRHFESILKCLYNKYPEYDYVFIPSAEALNRFLLDNRGYFTSRRVIIPLVEKKLYESISDKYSFRVLCQESFIATPKVYHRINKLPVVAKPKKYVSLHHGKSLYPYLIITEADLTNFFKLESRQDFYFEEFVEGESYYLLYYFSKNGDVISYSQKNLVQQPDGKSIIAAEPATLHNHEISNKFTSILRKLNFWGLVMVEVRFDGTDYYMIEANPRLWGPSQLFVDAGVKFFEQFLVDTGFDIEFDSLKSDADESLKYFWFGGLANTMKEKRKPVYHRGMTENRFFEQLDSFMQNDVYLRKDTVQIYLREVL